MAESKTNPSSRSGPLLKDQAYQSIKEKILSDEFGPGTFISERQIAQLLKMSKTPIKAAFERLEHEGFISISPQQGVVVRDLNIQEVADHFELRTALESFVVRNIAGRLTSEQTTNLQDLLRAQQTADKHGDISESVTLDGDFHLFLCQCLGNQEIYRVMRELKDKIRRVVLRVYSRHPERPQSSYAEHKRIVAAITKGDSEKAALLMIEHLDNGRRFLLGIRRPLKKKNTRSAGN